MKVIDQYSCLEYELSGVVFRLMELVVQNFVMPVREDVRGLLREWRHLDLPLKTVFQCKFAEQLES